MFWGITIEHGKVYCQVAERSFHLSMAALGFEDVSSDPISVMVEINKAQFVLCTLQAGKIPHQSLDHNFTEGEEVRFFLEGGKGQVHLTGYLFEAPQEVRFDEFQAMTDTDESESSIEGNDDSEKDTSLSSNEATPGELANVNELDSDDEDDEDWTPKKLKQKKSKKICTEEEEPQVNFMDLGDDYDSEDDEDWVPGKEFESKDCGKLSKDIKMEEEEKKKSSDEHDVNFDLDDATMSTSDESKEVNSGPSDFCSSDESIEDDIDWRKYLVEGGSDDLYSTSDEDDDDDLNWQPKIIKEEGKTKKRTTSRNKKEPVKEKLSTVDSEVCDKDEKDACLKSCQAVSLTTDGAGSKNSLTNNGESVDDR